MILILITSLYELHCFIVTKSELVCGILFQTYFGVLSVPDLIIRTLSEKAICSHIHHSDEWIWLWPFWFVAVLDVIPPSRPPVCYLYAYAWLNSI